MSWTLGRHLWILIREIPKIVRLKEVQNAFHEEIQLFDNRNRPFQKLILLPKMMVELCQPFRFTTNALLMVCGNNDQR